MKLLEAIDVINSKQQTVIDVVQHLQCSRDLFKSILKENGFSYDNKQKIYIHKGKGDPVDFDLEPIIKERQERQNNNRNKTDKKKNENRNNTEINLKKVRNKSETTQRKSDLNLTESEIKFIKNLAKGRDKWQQDFELNYAFSKLPTRKPTKKTSYEISMATFEQFEEFAATTGDRHRMSKNDLVEIALLRLIKDFS